MGAVRESFEVSLEAAIELDVVEEDKHAAIIAAARVCADAIDAGSTKSAMLATYLSYCKTLGIVPARQDGPGVAGSGRVARMRAHSRANLKAV